MPERSSLTVPFHLLIRFALTILLVYLLNTYFDQYFTLTGGLRAYITVAALITLMNILVRPILHILTAPVHFIFGILATIGVNALFLWITMSIAEKFDPSAVQLIISGGFWGWLVIAIILGVANWLMKHLVRT